MRKKKRIELDGNNVVVIPFYSFRACYYLLKSKLLFVQHSVWLDFCSAPFTINNFERRLVVNLWHGIPIKDISHHNTGLINKSMLLEMPSYRIIASSELDLENMKKTFYLSKPENFWITGLPRNDYLLNPIVPNLYQDQLNNVVKIKNNQKLILYVPTYRETNSGGYNYEFTNEELQTLNNFLVSNNCILGVRYHIYRKPATISNLLGLTNVFDMSETVVSDVRIAIRKADIVITDYSSIFVDALYVDKACISFAYDYEQYMAEQRGFFYNFDEIFPGPICYSFNQLLDSVKYTLSSYSPNINNHVKMKLFKYLDAENSKRVLLKIKEELNFQ